MRGLANFVGYSVLLLSVAAAHIGLAAVLPYPLGSIHIVFIFLIFALLFTDSGVVVWLAFFLFYVLDLYGSTPFGIILFSGTVATLCTYYTHRYAATNRTYLGVALLSFSALLSNRFAYILAVVAVRLVRVSVPISVYGSVPFFLWEAFITAGLTIILFTLARRASRHFSVTYLGV